jgi:hypothetical protein
MEVAEENVLYFHVGDIRPHHLPLAALRAIKQEPFSSKPQGHSREVSLRSGIGAPAAQKNKLQFTHCKKELVQQLFLIRRFMLHWRTPKTESQMKVRRCLQRKQWLWLLANLQRIRLLGKAAVQKRNFFPPALGQRLGAEKGKKNWGKRGKKKRTTLFLVLFLGSRKKTEKLRQKNCPAQPNYRAGLVVQQPFAEKV